MEALKRYEEELRDSAEFEEWQKSMLEKDRSEREAEIAQRKLDMAASQEAAVMAKKAMVRGFVFSCRLCQMESTDDVENGVVARVKSNVSVVYNDL